MPRASLQEMISRAQPRRLPQPSDEQLGMRRALAVSELIACLRVARLEAGTEREPALRGLAECWAADAIA